MSHSFQLNVKMILLENGLTQKDLAKEIGIAPSSISNTINGDPKLSTIVKYAKALSSIAIDGREVTPCELIKGEVL